MKNKFLYTIICVSFVALNTLACSNNSFTSNTQTESQTKTEAESQTEIETESEAESDLVIKEAYLGCLEAIYDVQAGAAGSSLRAESATETIKLFCSEYGIHISDEDLIKYTTDWFDEMSKDNASFKTDFEECFFTTTDVAYANDPKLETELTFTKIITSITEALK